MNPLRASLPAMALAGASVGLGSVLAILEDPARMQSAIAVTRAPSRDEVADLYRAGFVFTENWLYCSASVTMSPLPPIKLCRFFAKDGSRPWILKAITQRNAEFDCMVSAVIEEHTKAHKAASSVEAVVTRTPIAEVQNIVHENQKARCKRAREKASEAWDAKVSRRTIVLG